MPLTPLPAESVTFTTMKVESPSSSEPSSISAVMVFGVPKRTTSSDAVTPPVVAVMVAVPGRLAPDNVTGVPLVPPRTALHRASQHAAVGITTR